VSSVSHPGRRTTLHRSLRWSLLLVAPTVSASATRAGLPVLEVRTVSNAVGPRDRAAWRIPEALRALTEILTAVVPVLTAPGSPTARKDRR
jgi:hypothetical protein